MADYRTFYQQQRSRGKTAAQARAAWAKAKAKASAAEKIEKNVVERASRDIYLLAESLFGHSDFLHEAGMMTEDSDHNTIAVELSRSRDTKTKKGWSTWNVDSPEFIEGLRGIQKKYKPYGLKMTVAVRNPMPFGSAMRRNPYAEYATDVSLPGLSAKKGSSYYYPSRPAALGAPGVVAEQKLPSGYEIVPGVHFAKNGKRAWIFRLFLNGKDTGRYATSPERAAELAFRLRTEGDSIKRDYSAGKLKARFNPFWVSPAGTAGYLSEESHAAYKQKHPTRGRVPSFMERQVRMESPNAELPAGWEIRTVTAPGLGGKPQEQYHLFYGGRDIGKYALDWNKAVEIAQRTDPKTGKRIWKKN